MQTWFEGKLKYMKVAGTGNERMATEQFLLDAVSFTDAETRMITQAQQMVRGGEFTVKDIKQSQIAEVFPYENGEWWWKVKVQLVSIDENAGREKKVTDYYLIMADDVNQAVARIDESLEYLVIPYTVVTLNRTNIADVFPYDPEEAAAEMQKQNSN